MPKKRMPSPPPKYEFPPNDQSNLSVNLTISNPNNKQQKERQNITPAFI